MGKESPGKTPDRLRRCVESCGPPIVLHVPNADSFPSRLLTSSCCYRLFVRSVDVRLIRHLSAATGRRLNPSFFIHISWCCPISGCSSHVDFRYLNSSGEFRFSLSRTTSFPSDASRLLSHSMLGAVVGRWESPRAFIHGTALPWSTSGHSLGPGLRLTRVDVCTHHSRGGVPALKATMGHYNHCKVQTAQNKPWYRRVEAPTVHPQ